MTYCTLQQLQDRYGDRMLIQLTDRSQPASGAIDVDVVNRAIADTDGLVDGHLSVRYQLPLSEIPALVVDLAQAIVIYKLHRKTASDKIEKDYDGALKLLRDLSNGKVRLDVAGAEPASSGNSDVITNEPARPMTSKNMTGLI